MGIKPISAVEIEEYNSNYYHLIQDGNKVSGKSIIIKVDDINNATLPLEDGTTAEFHRENSILSIAI